MKRGFSEEIKVREKGGGNGKEVGMKRKREGKVCNFNVNNFFSLYTFRFRGV